MKKIFLISLLMSVELWASSLSQKLEDKKYYYSALNEYFMETYHKRIVNEDIARLENLLFYTGIELLEDYDASLLEKYPSSSTRFILGKKSMKAKKNDKAIEFFGLVHKDHRYYPEAKLLEAQIYAEKGDKKEFDTVEMCLNSAEKNESGAPNEKIKRYYRMVYEICLVNKARHQFRHKNYQAAIDAYNKIPKESYKWPYILLEKAWVYYQLGDYNRTLGILVTYKSPLMDTYFFPEAEYLASLAYFRLCLWEDSSIIIDQYYKFYRPRFEALEKVLRTQTGSKNYFYNLMFGSAAELKDHEDFIHHIVTRLKKQIRFSLDFNAIHKLDIEAKRIMNNERPEVKNKLLGHLVSVRENMMTKINYNAKTDILKFLESVPFYSSELFKLNLEIISRKKDLIYGNKKLIADRGRGDYANVKRSRFEHFWKFHGEFWADELGDYSLGLKSNCEMVKNEAPIIEAAIEGGAQ